VDELVRQALVKWPNVPDCYGWLALDRRGQWRLGQERQTITNPTIGAFIARNYISDEAGRWMFQNGPQRVFVDLDYTPWIWRTVPDGNVFAIANHAGQRFTGPAGAWIDEDGRILLRAGDGPIGVVHDHDTEQIVDWMVAADGAGIGAGALEERLLNLSCDKPTGLFLAWPGQHDPVSLIAINSRDAEALFQFIAHPLATQNEPPSTVLP
jgi:hypothetical protein